MARPTSPPVQDRLRPVFWLRRQPKWKQTAQRIRSNFSCVASRREPSKSGRIFPEHVDKLQAFKPNTGSGHQLRSCNLTLLRIEDRSRPGRAFEEAAAVARASA